MNTYHTLAARHQVEMVNHFIAVIDCDTIVAIYNDKTNTVQVYAAHAPLHTHRVVQFNKANDARCMFSHIPAAANSQTESARNLKAQRQAERGRAIAHARLVQARTVAAKRAAQ